MQRDSTEALRYRKMYDKYALEFNNMQIIVGQVKDNWKGARLKGSSSLHMVDRFSISLQVERKTVETTDPAWPSIIISATKVADPFQLGEGGHIEAHCGQAAGARLLRQEGGHDKRL